jgi:hypothetical protein
VPPLVLAVHDLRLVGMQPQPDLFHPVPDRLDQLPGLTLSDAMHDRVVGIALEADGWILPRQPHIERIVHEQVRQHRRDYASNAMGNFCFDVTLNYQRLERPRRTAEAM